ncbi:hypothetical protein HAHI6034_07830 [Hathewaya histolytica]|uniref:Uncharacterized protein n=1 Tax=Hathewaya histolytica TaxID=1498 RepID=A0A4U9QZY6_HATHI|nr:Uncharacterised protein [Hathewaya histolytica]
MCFRDKVKRAYFIVGIVLFILNMIVIPYFLSVYPFLCFLNMVIKPC